MIINKKCKKWKKKIHLLASQDFTIISRDFTLLLKTSYFFFQLHLPMECEPSSMCNFHLLLFSISKTSMPRESSNQVNPIPKSCHQFFSFITINLGEFSAYKFQPFLLSFYSFKNHLILIFVAKVIFKILKTHPKYDMKDHLNLVTRFTP